MRRKGKTRIGRYKSWPLVACIGLVLLAASVVAVGPASAQGQTKTLRIGVLMCLSGWYAAFDAMDYKHVQAVAEMINDRGGLTVKGEKYKIQLVAEDGKSTMDGISAGATRLAYDQKVKFVIGPDAFYSSASSPVFEQAKVLHVSGWNSMTPGEMDASTPYGFCGFNNTPGILNGTIQAIKKEYPNVKRIAITSADDGSGSYLFPKVKKVFAANGYTWVSEVLFPNEMEDFNPIAAKANAIKDTDAYMNLLSSPVAVASIIKGLRSLGNNKPVFCVQTVPAAEILAICGKAAGNDVVTSGIIPHAKGNPALVDEVFNRAGKKPPMFLLNPNGLWELGKIIQAANSIDPTDVRNKWESMETVETLFGPGIICGDETYGIKHHAVSHPVPWSRLMKGEVVNGGWFPAKPVP